MNGCSFCLLCGGRETLRFGSHEQRDALQLTFVSACAKGLRHTVLLTLACGADVNAYWRQDSALHQAAENGHVQVVRLLLAHGAEVDKLDRVIHVRGHSATEIEKRRHCLKQDTPLYRACHGFRSMMAPSNHHIAQRYQEICRLLIENGADLYRRNKESTS